MRRKKVSDTQGNVKDLILVISGPSGSGKGTVIDILIDRIGCRKAVSVTTRAPRAGEIDGRDYYFISRERFDSMLEGGELLEYNIYNENGYGTPRSEVENALKSGTRLILDVDVNGAMNIGNAYPDARRVFIIPPSASEQRRRIEGRGTNTQQSIEDRMNIARDELGYWDKYDCVIVNENGQTERTADQIIDVMNGIIPDQSNISATVSNYFNN